MGFLRGIPDGTGDEELVARYRAGGDAAVLGTLYGRYMELVYGVCLNYLEPEDARDAVMNIYEELTTKLRRHEVDNFRPWLHTLAKNHCLMKLRGAKGAKIVNIEDSRVYSEEDLHPSAAFDREQRMEGLDDCIDRLGAEQKTVIKAFYLERRSYDEIAASTGLDWSRVRSALQNGRRNLKICMEKKGAYSA